MIYHVRYQDSCPRAPDVTEKCNRKLFLYEFFSFVAEI